MLYLGIAAKGMGKTTFMREVFIPKLMSDPASLTPLYPANGFALALVDDPNRPETGYQYHGARYPDVAAWRRASRHARVSCFDAADPEALMQLALELRREMNAGVILVADELDKYLPSGRPIRKGSAADKIINEGRHYGVACVGTVRSLRALHREVRDNIEGAVIGNLATPDGISEKFAAELIGLGRDRAFTIGDETQARHFRDLGRGEFLVWTREDRKIIWTKYSNGGLTLIRAQGAKLEKSRSAPDELETLSRHGRDRAGRHLRRQ